ncbi:MAG: GYD domain-containing protein [Thiotrichales bacterium]
MATFITLINLTDQGARNIKESPQRFEAFAAMAEKVGVAVKGAYYTMGEYDMVIITEGPEEAAAALLVKLGSLGNVRMETLRGYSVAQMKEIIAKAMP